MQLPVEGLASGTVRQMLAAAGEQDMPWEQGRGWSLVYDLPGEHSALVADASAMYAAANGLSASAFPSAARFESAVIAMTASVVAPQRAAFGVFTSGGTESIMLAVKAARDREGAPAGGEVVVPVTAHPAFGKAAAYLGLRLRTVPVGKSGAVDPTDLVAATSSDTALVGLSAPNFPYGVLDPIPDVAAELKDRGTPLHVDAALGGLFLPFLDGASRDSTGFGLDVDGVTSVSVDLHKYGYGAKGASVLLFADAKMRHASYYVDTSWPGGAYTAAGVLGTRPVGAAAAAFASMVSLGHTGYRTIVEQVMTTTRRLVAGFHDAGPFAVIGDPAMSVFAVTGPEQELSRAMYGLTKRGWSIDGLTRPLAMHFVVFPRHASVIERFLTDVQAAVNDPNVEDVDGISSYGVMVRGGPANEDALREHLDRRFEAGPATWLGEGF
jgi:glutamate/tyrosine decarboxylase-like PLP-dependent enzyme